MTLIWLLLLAAASAATFAMSQDCSQGAWEEYKEKFHKSYSSEDEDSFRFDIFCKNVKMIEEHNAKYNRGEVSYSMGLNQFSDMTMEEIRQIM
ncbi:digestive cysteine proteinase 1-like isoform X2 [Dermacentor silvarum]|uniref:digestive cysteine proteinase 1-like isoform X2 n=1 Tax=Dermacentor silvarum TaxID=543639 RepID=UPI0021014F23|nr:digestive cysteine proteinase 1-like isoform X2 [Dermacentor silvarum]